MGKKKHAEEHENLERWLVSYADFITLLFATFVVLYALSQIDLAKFKELKISLRKAFSHSSSILKGQDGIMNNKGVSLLDSGGQVDTENVVPPILEAIAAKEEEETYKALQEELKLRKIDELKGVKTEVTERGFVIKMIGNIFFETSVSELKQESLDIIRQIGELVKENFSFNIIRVEGHTDNDPIKSEQFPSNWELSSYRAASVVRYMTGTVGMKKDRFLIVGYADSRPIASNETEQGKKANRRVEIVVLRSKLLGSELKTRKFQQNRIQRLETISRAEQARKEKEKQMSDAARKLMEEGIDLNKSLIITDDKYKKEQDKILKQLKKFEDKAGPDRKKNLFFNSMKKELRNKKEAKKELHKEKKH